MSESVSSATEVLPVDEFQLNNRGMTAWKAVYDRLIVDPLPGGMRAFRVEANSVTVYERILTAHEAAHLANLLTQASPTES